jgi:uncharacterized cupredoxin-like copper-binding protein
MIRRLTLVGALVGASLALALPAVAASNATGVTVTAGKPSEFKFTLSKTSVAKGATTFTVTNKGKLEHNLKIGGKQTATLKPGKKATLTVTLKAGKAAYLCTLPGHAAGGMKGTLTVK